MLNKYKSEDLAKVHYAVNMISYIDILSRQ